MEDIFSDLLDNIEQLHKQGLQALKEYKLKNPNWDKKQENKFKKIESSIDSYIFGLASDKCIHSHNGLI
tara:strand:+ start:302 stop:508 length:207 start_codon:yes stop_codon:yes gene_type:complete